MRAAALAALCCLAAAAARAAPPVTDPDWPCQQPLMPTVSAAALWSGGGADAAADWQAAPEVAALVKRIAPRAVAAADGVAAIADFAQPLSPEARQRLLPLVFSGLVAETNDARSLLIAKLKEFGARQRNLSALVARLTAEFDAITAEAQGDDARRRADLAERMTYTTRAFEGMQRTLRYACEAPVALEARLGAYARALQKALK